MGFTSPPFGFGEVFAREGARETRPGGRARGRGAVRLGVERVEVGEEGRVLLQVALDSRESCRSPILEPALAEVVLDAVHRCFSHTVIFGRYMACRNEPNGPNSGTARPIGSTARDRLPARQPGQR